MKKSKKQKEYDEMKKELEQLRDDVKKSKYDRDVADAMSIAENMIKNSTSRNDLREKLTDWIGVSEHEYIDKVLYDRFPLTKLEKALK